VTLVLELEDVSKVYPGEPPVTALDGVSFSVSSGELVGVVGPSGSGKTTLLHLIGTLDRPTSGTVRITGMDVAKLSDRELSRLRGSRIGFVFQQFFLAEHATILDNVADGLLYAGVPLRERRREAIQALEQVGLADRISARPTQLSGGQRQRVAIARALASNPDVLLADEPVSMLDVSIRLEILNLLDRLKRERNLALLYVTHDLATARHFSSQIMVMYRGEIVERGPADEVILRPSHPYTQLLASAAPDPGVPREQLAAARRAREVLRASVASAASAAGTAAERRELLVGEGCRFRLRCPHAMDTCASRPPDIAVSADHHALCWLYADGGKTGPVVGSTAAASTPAGNSGTAPA
jgi:peptide/nickel transport system ATP-binding protein